MKRLSFIGKEFRYWFGNWKRVIPVIAIMTVPILYAGTFLWSFWDPYGHLDRLPVAVVNLDRGATLNGKNIDIGENLVSNLKDNRNFEWRFVSESAAQSGLNDNQYFMEIEIPKNLSQQAVDAIKNHTGVQPKIVSITNDRYNFIAATIGKNAVEQIKEQTAQGVSDEYSKNLIQGINTMANGYQSAAHGAEQIANGTNKLGDKSDALRNGSTELVAGMKQLTNGINTAGDGVQSLRAGTAQLDTESGQLSQGLNKLSASGSPLETGAKQTLSGLTGLQQGVQASANGVNQTAAGAANLSAGMQQYAATHPDVANDANFQKLLVASKQLQQGSYQLEQSQGGLLSGSTQLVQGQTQFVNDLESYTTGLNSAAKAANQLAIGQDKVDTGLQQLQSGLTSLQAGANGLSAGASNLQNGIDPYTGAVTKLSSGVNQLATQLGNASNQASQSKTSIQTADKLATTISKPIGLSQHHLGTVSTYGAGFAPYFLSLGLFVGALLMSIVIEFRKPAGDPKSGLSWFLGKFAVLASVGVIQAVIADVVILKGLGLQVQSVPQFFGFSILISLAFVALVQFLVTSMANPGRFVAVILLILQLTSSSGSYPTILSPAFFQNIGRFLPMTYSIEGFRYIIGGGNAAFMHTDVRMLVIWAVSFLVLTLAYLAIRYRFEFRGESAVHPVLDAAQ